MTEHEGVKMTEIDTNLAFWKAANYVLSRFLDATPKFVVKNRISYVGIDDGNFTIRSSAGMTRDSCRFSLAFNLKSEINRIDVWVDIGKADDALREISRKSFLSPPDRKIHILDDCIEFLSQSEQEIKLELDLN